MQQPADTRGFRATPSAPIGPDGDRTSTWLPLLQRLTDAEPDWLVLKHPESAFTGTGDIDSAAPRDAWPAIADAFRSWAAEMSLGAVVECPHAPGWLHLVALDPSGGRFWELDVNERKLMLGSTFYRAEDLLGLATVDARGFRRVRAGAEGLIKLVHNGTRRGGRENDQGIRAKRIRELLAEDPSGVAAAGRLFGRAEPAARRGAAACVAGRWDRAAMLVVEARFLARVLVEPRGIAWRVRFRLERRSCPLLRAVFAGRRHPLGSPESWLDAVRHTHRVDMPT